LASPTPSLERIGNSKKMRASEKSSLGNPNQNGKLATVAGAQNTTHEVGVSPIALMQPATSLPPTLLPRTSRTNTLPIAAPVAASRIHLRAQFLCPIQIVRTQIHKNYWISLPQQRLSIRSIDPKAPVCPNKQSLVPPTEQQARIVDQFTLVT
jgi:hypothetical protein